MNIVTIHGDCMNTNLCAMIKVIGYIALQILKGIAVVCMLIAATILLVVLLPVAVLLSPFAFIIPVLVPKNTKDKFVNVFITLLIPLFIISDIVGIFLNRGTVTKSAVHTYVHYTFDVFSFDIVFAFIGIILSILIISYPEAKNVVIGKYRDYLEKCKK